MLVYKQRGHDMEGRLIHLEKGQALGPKRNQGEKTQAFPVCVKIRHDPQSRPGDPVEIPGHLPQIKSAFRDSHEHRVCPLCKENFLSTLLLNLKVLLIQ